MQNHLQLKFLEQEPKGCKTGDVQLAGQTSGSPDTNIVYVLHPTCYPFYSRKIEQCHLNIGISIFLVFFFPFEKLKV